MTWPANGSENWNDTMKAHVEVSLATDGKVKDGAVMSTDAPPTVPEGVANMKYVDDQKDPAYSGEESYTFGGGLTIKSGYKSGTGDQTVAFDSAFSTKCISFVMTDVDTSAASGGINSVVKTLMGVSAKSAVDVWINTGHQGANWIAIGI
jgi:hypothetical protein